ncbi:MAG: hypothetical protein IPI99_13935 [Saprospiraceae bacterium]|nr:hypothetical protein [Saprospiraceae bacterium]
MNIQSIYVRIVVPIYGLQLVQTQQVPLPLLKQFGKAQETRQCDVL